VTQRRELAHRSANGVEVTLLWDPETDVVSLEASDAATGEVVVLVVPRALALDAFRHPFAYAAGDPLGLGADQAARTAARRSSRAILGM